MAPNAGVIESEHEPRKTPDNLGVAEENAGNLDKTSAAANYRAEETHVISPPGAATEQGSKDAPKKADHSETFNETSAWLTAFTELKRQDEEMCKEYREEVDALLTFAGPFSAALTAFVVDSYENLQPDHTETSARLLLQISQQMANASYNPEITSFESPFQPTISTVRINTLWLVSLVLSLMASLFCIFVKQWVRMYMKWTEVLPLQTAMALRQYRYNGLQQWGLPAALAIMPAILQLALALFLVGLVDLLLPIHLVVGVATAVVVYGFLVIAAILTLLPLVWRASPFKTPVIEAVLPIIYKTIRPCIVLTQSIIHWYYYKIYDGYNQQISSCIDYLESLVQGVKKPSILGFWKWLDVHQVKSSEKSLSEPLSVSAIGHLYSFTPNEDILFKILPCLGLWNPDRAKLADAWPAIAVLAGVDTDSWRLPAVMTTNEWVRVLCQSDGFRPRKLQHQGFLPPHLSRL